MSEGSGAPDRPEELELRVRPLWIRVLRLPWQIARVHRVGTLSWWTCIRLSVSTLRFGMPYQIVSKRHED